MLRDLAVNAYSTVLHGAVEDDQKYYMMHICEFQTPALYKNKPGDIDSLVRRFLAEFGDRRSLDVHYGTNRPIFVRQESVDLIDWLAVWPSIKGWTGELTLSERTKVGTLRGIMFESKVRAFLERQLGAALTFWPPRERPRSEPERLRRRDVDLAVILDDVIVLVECKVKIGKEAAVTNVSPLEHQEEWQRSLWKGARKWLSQVDETASALATVYDTEDGYTLPPSIRCVVPVVCSPIVAYIGMTDPEYFLTPNIPRVCTPRELVELLKLGTSIALNCPAVHKVARR
jgi:hypothetical protein